MSIASCCMGGVYGLRHLANNQFGQQINDVLNSIVGAVLSDHLQADPDPQQRADDLSLTDISSRIEKIQTRFTGRKKGRYDQAGTRPIVELLVGDASDPADS